MSNLNYFYSVRHGSDITYKLRLSYLNFEAKTCFLMRWFRSLGGGGGGDNFDVRQMRYIIKNAQVL